MKTPLIPVDEIPADGATPIKFFERDILVYRAGGIPQAVFNACVHLGGPLQRDGDTFVCPWHGARFDCTDGSCLSGPEGTHDQLLMLPTRIEDGVLMYVYGE